MKTTLNAIKNCSPCIEGYSKLLKFLGKTKADDEPLAVSVILESNGLDDTVWCFRTVSGYDAEKRLFAVFCAKQVQHLMTSPRSIDDVSERFAHGQATVEELTAARDAAAVAYAARAAYDAAYYAYDAANAAYSAAYTACAADPEIQSVLESYLKELFKEL